MFHYSSHYNSNYNRKSQPIFKAERKKEDKQKVLNLAEWERNQKQMAKMKSLQKNQESLLSSHQKKMEAEEENDTGPKMRVAFDREKDMQGNIRFFFISGHNYYKTYKLDK